MKKHSVILVVAGLLVLGCVFRYAVAGDEWENIGRELRGLRTVLIDPDSPGIIYIGSDSGVFKTDDAAQTWRNILSLRGQGRSVNFLAFDPKNKGYLYAATGNGLFLSLNQGKTWKRIFMGKSSLENECSCISISQDIIYLGTKGGLFLSRDNGRTWNRQIGRLGDSRILAIAHSKSTPGYVYVACADGIFRSPDKGGMWERIFSEHPVENGSEGEEATDDSDEQERFSNIRYISCDTVNSSCIYLATSIGVYKSCDDAKSWDPFTSYGLLSKGVNLLLFSEKGVLYAVTGSGVFEYSAGRWQELSFSLESAQVRFLALDKEENLYVACEEGLFKMKPLSYKRSEGRNVIPFYCKDEPKIKDIQQAAIRYAEVEPEKIKRWRKQAAKKAALPQVSVGLDRNVTDLWHWETGSSTKFDDDILRKGRDGLEWSVRLAWDLGELIWNDDQTSIDVRSRLMVELRDDILDEVTRLYFERIRVKMELDNLSIEDRKKRFEKELKIQELTASIDSLTGGYFSAHLS